MTAQTKTILAIAAKGQPMWAPYGFHQNTSGSLICVKLPNLVKISQTTVEFFSRFKDFHYAGLTLSYELDLSKVNDAHLCVAEHLFHISRKSKLYFSRHHNKRNERTHVITVHPADVMLIIIIIIIIIIVFTTDNYRLISATCWKQGFSNRTLSGPMLQLYPVGPIQAADTKMNVFYGRFVADCVWNLLTVYDLYVHW